ncbi:MAG: hypothetical protein ACRDTA_07610 [Pseudonocardiaceae bacterium]
MSCLPAIRELLRAGVRLRAGGRDRHAWSRFVVVMIGAPGESMLTLVDDAELDLRRDRRASRPT